MILSLLHVAVQMNPYSYITPNYFYVDYKRYFNVEPGIQRGASSNGCNVGRILLPCNCETLVSTIKSQLFQPSPAASRFIFHHFELCSNPFFCCSCPEYLWMKLALSFLMGLLFELHSHPSLQAVGQTASAISNCESKVCNLSIKYSNESS